MRYQLELELAAPRERVVELFLDPENIPKWQPSLVGMEPIGDITAREPGAQTRQLHKMGKREVEMIETTTVHNYPDEFCATYESDDVWNLIENRFYESGPETTRWELVSEFRSTNWMMKVMIVLFPGMFKKQTRTFMDYFKQFVESNRDIAGNSPKKESGSE